MRSTDAVMMTPIALAQSQLQSSLQPAQSHLSANQAISSKAVSLVPMDVMEQKHWWHLEEVS